MEEGAGSNVLPVGMPILAQASLAAVASCDLLLQGIRLVPPPDDEAGERPSMATAGIASIHRWI